MLESVELWYATDAADPSKVRAITLFDLFYSVFVLVVTFLLTRHLPPLSEVFMREWFNMSPGARYATSILMQYVVIAIGVSTNAGERLSMRRKSFVAPIKPLSRRGWRSEFTLSCGKLS